MKTVATISILITLSFDCLSQQKDTTETAKIKTIIRETTVSAGLKTEAYDQQLTKLIQDKEEAEGKYQVTLDSIEFELGKITKLSDTRFQDLRKLTLQNFQELRGKLKEVETKEYKISLIKFKSIEEAIKQMKASTTIISYIQEFALFETEITSISSFWADSLTRNLFDKIKGYGTLAGTTLATIGLSDMEESDGSAMAAAGIGFVGLAQGLGFIFGNENANKIKKKIEFIAYSRRAYDDLLARNNALKKYLQNNESFIDQLAQFELDYTRLKSAEDNPDSLGMYQNFVADFKTQLSNFETILQQIPEYLIEITAVNDNYIKYFKKNHKELHQKLSNLNIQAENLRIKYYEDVLEFLAISNETLRIIDR